MAIPPPKIIQNLFATEATEAAENFQFKMPKENAAPQDMFSMQGLIAFPFSLYIPALSA
jgi:hypothetical protein